MRKPRKFKVGDEVMIVHDHFLNYPQGTVGVVTFEGMRRTGVPTYHVKFDEWNSLRLWETELAIIEHQSSRTNEKRS